MPFCCQTKQSGKFRGKREGFPPKIGFRSIRVTKKLGTCGIGAVGPWLEPFLAVKTRTDMSQLVCDHAVFIGAPIAPIALQNQQILKNGRLRIRTRIPSLHPSIFNLRMVKDLYSCGDMTRGQGVRYGVDGLGLRCKGSGLRFRGLGCTVQGLIEAVGGEEGIRNSCYS